jgi:hypothetical protein
MHKDGHVKHYFARSSAWRILCVDDLASTQAAKGPTTDA